MVEGYCIAPDSTPTLFWILFPGIAQGSVDRNEKRIIDSHVCGRCNDAGRIPYHGTASRFIIGLWVLPEASISACWNTVTPNEGDIILLLLWGEAWKSLMTYQDKRNSLYCALSRRLELDDENSVDYLIGLFPAVFINMHVPRQGSTFTFLRKWVLIIPYNFFYYFHVYSSSDATTLSIRLRENWSPVDYDS